ncbi:MAG: hypothetical protein E6G50_06935 [Actinobacteria bacterium]|nr:MAG: hypothetical protein E6G50_06935 [Actinomycetota bacterium]
MSELETRNCTLRLSAQNVAEPCPRDLCVFWEPGGAVVDAACGLERLALDVRRPDVAAYLLELRERLDQEREVGSNSKGGSR